MRVFIHTKHTNHKFKQWLFIAVKTVSYNGTDHNYYAGTLIYSWHDIPDTIVMHNKPMLISDIESQIKRGTLKELT